MVMNKKAKSNDFPCFSPKGKKGSELTLSTIIIIVLGIAVLVFLIFGFATGWTNLWNKITAYGGGNANVDTIKQACILACSQNAVSTYCATPQTVKFDDKTTLKGSCRNLEGTKANIEPCPISCTTEDLYKQTCADLGGAPWQEKACAEGKTDLTAKVTKVEDKPTATANTPYCCQK